MDEYIIKKIVGNGYERKAQIVPVNKRKDLVVHFVEYDEKLVREIDSSVTGELKIDLAHLTDNKNISGFIQDIIDSPHIIANAIVIKIVDEFTLMCSIEGLSENIQVDFEIPISFKVADNINLSGILELEFD